MTVYHALRTHIEVEVGLSAAHSCSASICWRGDQRSGGQVPQLNIQMVAFGPHAVPIVLRRRLANNHVRCESLSRFLAIRIVLKVYDAFLVIELEFDTKSRAFTLRVHEAHLQEPERLDESRRRGFSL
jgi:hypothetical protein